MFVVHCSLFIGISFCSCCTYVYIAHFEIGFVLQKRLKATEVTENTEEWYIGEMCDRRPVYLWQAGQDGRVGQKTEDRRQETECGLAMNSRRAGICAAFRLCFDVDFDIDYLLFC